MGIGHPGKLVIGRKGRNLYIPTPLFSPLAPTWLKAEIVYSTLLYNYQDFSFEASISCFSRPRIRQKMNFGYSCVYLLFAFALFIFFFFFFSVTFFGNRMWQETTKKLERLGTLSNRFLPNLYELVSKAKINAQFTSATFLIQWISRPNPPFPNQLFQWLPSSSQNYHGKLCNPILRLCADEFLIACQESKTGHRQSQLLEKIGAIGLCWCFRWPCRCWRVTFCYVA